MSKPGRPARGSLVWTKSGWAARITTTVDGERVRVQRQLDTSNRAAAQRKLERLLASDCPAPSNALPAETFQQAAERVHAQRVRDGVQHAGDELARLRLYAFPNIAEKAACSVVTADVNEVLDFCKGKGKSRQTVAHVRQALRIVLDALRREGEIKTNPVDDADMPRFRTEVRKERAVLTDDELGAYLGFTHPLKQHRMPVLERQTMACVARCFGGLRTGDLHALDWSAFDVAQGGFEWGWAPRRKTKRPQLLEVPEMLRGILRDWWERHGRPAAGPVFPSRRGRHAGSVKGKTSHAKAFRRDLRRAFGVEAWVAEAGEFQPTRPLTRREQELFEETSFTMPVDFHSWRRAFTQALADADVTAQQATALAGHASLAAHARYLASSGKLRKVPEAALPGVLALPAPKPSEPLSENPMYSGGRDRTRTCDIRLVRPTEPSPETVSQPFQAWPMDHADRGSPGKGPERQNSMPLYGARLLDAALADACLAFALRGIASRLGFCVIARSAAHGRPSVRSNVPEF
jgi:integrase